MTISSKGRYALRVLIDLAENGGGEYIPMKVVAQRQGISLKYLEHILPALKQNNIVEGVQGKGGGYRLNGKPEDYTVGEILRLVEGDFAPVSCLECGAEPCERADRCRTISMWKNLQDMIDRYFDGITLRDLMQGGSNELSGIDISFLDASL
ncbi:MAG: RrF2 family transcriptional regulator [Ruminococcaceae bacterium]|nr:RrF2 family transcriptional regulator [Oscillospiraceae bacterium]MBD5116887.1 RrF2 family transcriptional regulator [Oscillospiraceae bacterium]